MNRFYISLVLFLSTVLCVACLSLKSELDDKVVTGFIIEENNEDKKFYIQDNEGGDFIELHFVNEYLNELSFEDFDQVEVIGLYNRRTNLLKVEEIIMLDEMKRTVAISE